MPRKAVHLVLMLLILACCADADAGMPFRRRSASDGLFPRDGDIPDLVRRGKPLSYNLQRFQELYGAAGNRYVQYGMQNMLVCEYTYGGKDRRLSIELATMDSPSAAAGLFHHHRGNVLSEPGRPVPVGAAGILDTARDGRNLYFYRGNIFAKIVYSGDDPVPDLLPIAEFIDAKAPKGYDDKPEGFDYIEVAGIDKDTIELTPGFTFNYSFLPASVTASAPAGGSVASDLFVITRATYKEAEQLYRDYTGYLKLYAEYIEEYKRGKQSYTKAVDPAQGRVVFTHYLNTLIIAARPDGYEKGEALIDQVMARVDEMRQDKKKKK